MLSRARSNCILRCYLLYCVPSRSAHISYNSIIKNEKYLNGHNLRRTQFTADQILSGPNCRKFEVNFGELGPAIFQ